ncbi:MAG: tRNA guanosine(34) transglycosylase Tgt, partial [Planctomycetes bacterium]|nr:tRNA guanosine(34) transglycosylase Tgt [Planctomycetota bacterium]
LTTDPCGARRGTLALSRGTVETPTFMPVGTSAAVKGVTPDQVAATGAGIILGNTYHLALAPGADKIAKLGGLHGFMGWKGPILTDSGGFQVFSLPKTQVREEGVTFEFEKGGQPMELSPERSMEIQAQLGSDIAMVFDECLEYPCAEARAAESVERTFRWERRSKEAHAKLFAEKRIAGTTGQQLLFGIVQGSTYPALRKRSAEQIAGLNFDGYAIGGVSVGEGLDLLKKIVGWTAPFLPKERARYLMGVGLPEDLFASVERGIDMFDCVIPTRYGRGGTLFTARGKLRIEHRKYRRDGYAVDTSCDCYTCATVPRAYLHHLFSTREPLGETFATIHNLRFYQRLMQGMRDAIEHDRFIAYRDEFLAGYLGTGGLGKSEGAEEST